MRAGRDAGFAPRAADSLARDALWPYAVPPAPRRVSPGSAPEPAPELAELAWATRSVRVALEELTVAAQAAADGARAIVAVMDAAVAVLDGGPPLEPRSGVAARLGGGLSPREREVLALVAEGRSNKAIAAALFVSPNTIKTHIASLMTKLQADSRAQLAAIAARQERQRSAAPRLGVGANTQSA